MQKTIKSILVACAAIAGLAACNNIDYDGEYSKDGYFESSNQIYFYFPNTGDTLRTYTFGPRSKDTVTHVVRIPVQIAGKTLDRPQQFKVSVDPSSTAKSGVHFTALPEMFTIAADSTTGYASVELLRANLSETEEEVVRLVLNLEASSDFGIRFSTNNRVAIEFDNYLGKPSFWDAFDSYYGLGIFTRSKYRKLLEYYDGDPDVLVRAYNNGKVVELYLNIRAVVAYFEAHPEEL